MLGLGPFELLLMMIRFTFPIIILVLIIAIFYKVANRTISAYEARTEVLRQK